MLDYEGELLKALEQEGAAKALKVLVDIYLAEGIGFYGAMPTEEYV